MRSPTWRRRTRHRDVPELEQAWRRANDFLGGIAGDIGEGPIDAQDDLVGIGDDDAFLGLEGGGGDLDLFSACLRSVISRLEPN